MTSIGTTGMEFVKGALDTADNIGDAIKPYVPLIKTVTSLISQIIQIYENAQYNKKFCKALLFRAEAAEFAVNILQRRQDENEVLFRQQAFYKSFIKFKEVLQRIKDFAGDVTNLHGFRKYLKSTTIKGKFTELIDDYDITMKDLSFTMVISSDEQRKIDKVSLEEDIAETLEFVKKVEGGIDGLGQKVNMVYQSVELLKTQASSTNNNLTIFAEVHAPEIDSTLLADPPIFRKDDQRGNEPFLVRKIYKQGIEVACKPITIPKKGTSEYQRTQTHLAILGKISESRNILLFYGISYVDNHFVMVSEWAEKGNLKEVYERYNITWNRKVHIVLDICRGIMFLNGANIFHHDIRCENVMVTKNLEPKLANFELSRMTRDVTSNIKSRVLKIINWLAPEKISEAEHDKYAKGGYTQKCEIFSFGMLIWELCFEKISYENRRFDEISSYVKMGGREKINFGPASPEDREIQKEFANIIKQAWCQNPYEHISIARLFLTLEKLASDHVISDDSSGLLPDKSIDLDGSKSSNDKDIPLPPFNEEYTLADVLPEPIKTVPLLEEGNAAHKNKEYEKAWKCFEENAKLGNAFAKYWQGYYLQKGLFVEKDIDRATKLYKEAADDGIPSAQFCYAFSIAAIKNFKTDPNKISEFFRYLNLASENGNHSAMFNLGDIYLNGRLGKEKDEKTALKYIKLAALNGDSNAIRKLKDLKVDIYDSDNN
ncbi:hypothetical protein RclHR1_02860015 [Rhizophagus clarus]|uniref:Kinase-like domain-containing protein n=1 Tax=Rhizophagus clarus TaxID=94130 RepID=A0A2Z6R7K3_9GLOM|nr:hypothetical protein RclHR1_02860015 [Rhizophagus clarus]GET02704.1 kinase-like domain-containing protein [Rhizophagus clarus]